jgi:predicted nucleotidyltransferase component of viral defense system
MKSSLLDRLLKDYEIKSDEDRFTAYREIFQEFALAGLYRGNFFQHAALYGETCLRLFYGLPRFSEDLDFSLLAKDSEFSLEPYLHKIIQEFKTLGIVVTIDRKEKKFQVK